VKQEPVKCIGKKGDFSCRLETTAAFSRLIYIGHIVNVGIIDCRTELLM